MCAQSACAQLGVDCSHHSSNSTPTISTQQIMQQQFASTMLNSFFNMLFSDDTQATEQKQKMMAELEARQAAAIQQQKKEEAARLAAICQKLQGTLKLSGTPELKLKSDASTSGGLQLKLGDQSRGHIGVPGLPGIALNDNTGQWRQHAVRNQRTARYLHQRPSDGADSSFWRCAVSDGRAAG